jgi:L,D-transpeptidase YcbB
VIRPFPLLIVATALATIAPTKRLDHEHFELMAGVRLTLDGASLPRARWPRITDVAVDVRRAYDSTGWQPLWLRDSRPTRQALDVVRSLGSLETVGLSPADYDAAALDSLAARLSSGPVAATTEDLVRFETTLSVASARVLSTLQWGRISPKDAHETFQIPRIDFDVATGIFAMSRAATPSQVMDGAEPQFLHYRLLKQKLAQYRALSRDTTLLPLPSFTRLELGAPYAGAAKLRRLLIALGDLPDSLVPPFDGDTLYASDIVEGVKRFQRREGERADGVAGPATRRALDRPFAQRVAQIALALERWRWLPREFAGRVIIVNVPEFRLHAFDRFTSDSTSLISMNVVVGEAFDHATPIFMKDLEYLVFSPFWEVPSSIMRREIRPRAVRDLSYLARNRYLLVRGYGEDAPEVPVTAENVAAIGSSVRVRQLPGDRNSLGRVKFMMPNPHNIYLHDTPSQSGFAQTRRDLSHGCIRLSDPLQLAEWVLRSRPEWTTDRIEKAMARDRPLTVSLGERIPVLVVYSTAVAQRDGEMHFYADIYGHDRRLAERLAAGYPYSR